MAKQKIPLQVICSLKNKITNQSKEFECHDIMPKSSTDKALEAAKVYMKGKKLHMSADEKSGYLITIKSKKGGGIVGYGVAKEAVNETWCREYSNESKSFIYELTPLEITSSSAKHVKTEERVGEMELA